MLEPGAAYNTVAWKPAGPDDASLWVSLTRRSADQITFELEEEQIARFTGEVAGLPSRHYILWLDEIPIGRLRFFISGSVAVLDELALLPEAGGGVAAQVVSEALVRAAASDVRHLNATYPAAYIASFAAAGFRELRRRTNMIASTDVSFPPPPLPTSLRVRMMLSGEGEQIGTLLQRAYAGGPDNVHLDVAGWRSEVKSLLEGQFGPCLPEACFVVEHSLDHYHLAGAILVHKIPGIAYIRHMAVAPVFRHVGLGQMLAVRAMRRLHDLDHTRVLLSVTLGIPAVNLYRRLGFTEVGPTYVEAERMLIK